MLSNRAPQHHPDDRNGIAFELSLTARRWRACVDARLAPLGLTQAKWIPLHYLARAGGSLPQRKLLERTGIEGPSLVRILDELERLGFIERRGGDADRRTKTVHLTRKAEPVIARIAEQADGVREEILDGISDRDLAAFRRILGRIAHNIGRVGP